MKKLYIFEENSIYLVELFLNKTLYFEENYIFRKTIYFEENSKFHEENSLKVSSFLNKYIEFSSNNLGSNFKMLNFN